MAAPMGLNRCQNFDVQIALTSDFDRVYDRLHGLLRACISDSYAYKVAVPFKGVWTE